MKLLHRRHQPAGRGGTVRVYTASGRIAHLALAGRLPQVVTLCPMRPVSGTWKGTGSSQEAEYAAVLPVCRLCQEAAGNTP